MIDLASEELIRLTEFAGRTNPRKTYRQLHKYVRYGVRGVKLEAIYVGEWHTSQQAWERFLAALNPENRCASLPPSPAQKKRRARADARKLKEELKRRR